MNWIGAKTLLNKEVRRFLRVPGQTLLSPLISTALYFIVFGVTLGRYQATLDGAPYVLAIVPGLIFMGASNNAFLNASSSMFITKLQGTVVDLLVAPLSPLALLFGFVAGAMVRGALVGILTWAVAMIFTGVHLAHPLESLALLLLVSYVFAMGGLLAGLWAEKFEQVNFFSTFIIIPLNFLGGVFFSVRSLEEPYRTIAMFNPVVHMVEGLRSAMLGTMAISPIGVAILLGFAAASTAVTYRLLEVGYHLKT